MKSISHHRILMLVVIVVVAVLVLGRGCISNDENPAVTSAQDLKWTERASDGQQKIITAIGKGTKVYQGTPSDMAVQFLKDNQDRLGLTNGVDDLQVLNGKARSFGANVEFQQIWKGLPVENGRIQINFDRQGHVVQVASSYTPPSGAVEQTTISKEQAVATVLEEFVRTTPDEPSYGQEQQQELSRRTSKKSEPKLKEEPRINDVFFTRRGQLRRAYQISVKAEQPFGIKHFVADANSGEILRTRDFVHYAVDGEGQVFNPNPINTLGNPTPTPTNMGDMDSAVSINNPNPYYTRALRDLEASTAPFTLRGPWVVLEHISGPAILPVKATSANGFMFRRSHDGFEEVMVYYHIDTMQRYIQRLGFTDVVYRPIRADAHGIVADQSRYVSEPVGEGYLAFGDGGVDDAEDADVIAHEYGHAMQDNQVPGKYTTTGMARAMGEGFGDYWAVSSFANTGHDPACVMEWDAVPQCKRRVDNGPVASAFNASSGEWVNGRIWSRTLYEIFSRLGKETTDRLVITSHFNIFDYDMVTFRDGAEAILAADEQLFASSNASVLCGVFVNRGIYVTSHCP